MLVARWKHHRALARRRAINATVRETLARFASYGWDTSRRDPAAMRREIMRDLIKAGLG